MHLDRRTQRKRTKSRVTVRANDARGTEIVVVVVTVIPGSSVGERFGLSPEKARGGIASQMSVSAEK